MLEANQSLSDERPSLPAVRSSDPDSLPDLSVWDERRLPTPRQPDDYRTPAEVDRARVIHSASFGRLQGKTQILNVTDTSFARTRLTHSMEVGQIGTGVVSHLRATDHRPLVQHLLPSHAQIDTICLIHDLGHPPLGHGGELALQFSMRNYGGFEQNAQTLRLLSKLEIYTEGFGSNLTRRTLLGALKYQKPYSELAPATPVPPVISPINGQVMLDRERHEPPKCYLDSEQDVVDWLLAPLSDSDRNLVTSASAKSFDSTLMDLADDFAYAIHDAEDAIALGLVTVEQMSADVNPALWDEYLDRLEARYPDEFRFGLRSRYDTFCDLLFSGDEAQTKKQIGRLVGYMISNTYVRERPGFSDPMYRFAVALRPAAQQLLNALKAFIFDRVINAPQLQQSRFKGQQMIVNLFACYAHDPRHLLPSSVYQDYAAAGEDEPARMRVICDYIASFTDASLFTAYERLFSPRVGTAFDHL